MYAANKYVWTPDLGIPVSLRRHQSMAAIGLVYKNFSKSVQLYFMWKLQYCYFIWVQVYICYTYLERQSIASKKFSSSDLSLSCNLEK